MGTALPTPQNKNHPVHNIYRRKNNNNNNQTTPNSILKNVFDGTKQQQNQNCNITVQKKFKKNQIKFHHHFVTEQINLIILRIYTVSVLQNCTNFELDFLVYLNCFF